MRKLLLCLFYGLCTFTIVFSLFWMALPKIPWPADSSSASPPPLELAAQAAPSLVPEYFYLCDQGGRIAVYRSSADGSPGSLLELTEIYVNLLPENDALRVKNGITVHTRRELDLLLEDLGG